MSNIVGISSMRSNANEITYVSVPEMSYRHLFSIDRLIRSAYKENQKAEWPDIVRTLEGEGYSYLPRPRNSNIFVFFRAWDEYLLNDGESFLVFFPESAAYELCDKIFLATPYPMYYAAISKVYEGGVGKVLLINEEHEPMYHDDMVWKDQDQTEKVALGPLHLVAEQFPSEFEYLKAKESLLASGYQVGDAPGSWNRYVSSNPA